MELATRHGVEYDLKRSPYVATRYGYNFHFSSVPHKEKFEDGLEKHVEWINDGLSRRFKMRIDFTLLAVFDWYRRVETRGFYVQDIYSEEAWECLGNLLFRGTSTSAEG